jgi:hypothetical protein
VALCAALADSCCTAGVLALLDEPEPELQAYALQKLNELVPHFWAEIADAVSKMCVSAATAGAAALPRRRLALPPAASRR